MSPVTQELPPSMLDPALVDAQPWTPLSGGSPVATDAVATTATTDAVATTVATDSVATTVATDAAATATVTTVGEVSTVDAIIAGAVGVEEGAGAVGLAAAPVPGVDVVVDTGALIVAAGAAVVLGGALLYKAMSDDTPAPAPAAQAPGHDPAPAPVQDPAPQQPVSAPSQPVIGPVQEPQTQDPAVAPGAEQPGPVQASDTQPKSTRYPVPTCDRITIHGTEEVVVYIYHADEIARAEWHGAIDDWQRSGELDHGISELETSIANREDAQRRLGEDSLSDIGTPTGATHRQRIQYERALLRAMMQGLGGH